MQADDDEAKMIIRQVRFNGGVKFIPLAFVIAIGAFACSAAPALPWQTVSLTGDITVSYPRTWRVAARSPGDFVAISPGSGARGIVIVPGQAELRIRVVDAGADQDVDHIIRAIVKDGPILSGPTLIESLEAPKRQCGSIQKAHALDELAPGIFIENSIYLCALSMRYVVVELRAWETGTARLEFENAARNMIQSVQLLDQNE